MTFILLISIIQTEILKQVWTRLANLFSLCHVDGQQLLARVISEVKQKNIFWGHIFEHHSLNGRWVQKSSNQLIYLFNLDSAYLFQLKEKYCLSLFDHLTLKCSSAFAKQRKFMQIPDLIGWHFFLRSHACALLDQLNEIMSLNILFSMLPLFWGSIDFIRFDGRKGLMRNKKDFNLSQFFQ